MAVNNYTRNCQYNLNNLDNYIYLYEFNQPILDYITDDEESNGSSISLSSTSYRIFCESVSYSSTSTVDNRFSFENTLTVTLAENKNVTHYKVIQTLLNNNWMVLFKNKEGDSFVMNAEYPVMVSYSYNFNDEKTPNTLTLTFRALQNVPTINYRGSVTFNSTLRDKPCEYTISRIRSLKMIDMNKGNISVSENSFSIEQKGNDSLKTIEFNPSSLSFVDAYDGREFTQTLSFTIPFNSYLYYFHYNLLEYLDNRYYALIETTNGNNILSGFKQGLFPSYSISTSDSGNLITINLNAKYTTYSLLGSDTMNITTNDGFYYVPILGECVNNIYTYTLLKQINANGTPTNGYYCLTGFEDIYSDYTILGTYNQFDTSFGLKLTDINIDCSSGCQLNGLPSSIQFTNSGETLCYDIETTCSVVWEWDNTAINVDYDEVNKRFCVTSISNEGTYNIKGTLTDGTIRYVTVIIGTGGVTGDTTTTINITAEAQTVSVIPSKGYSNVKSITSPLQYVINQNGNGYNVSVTENPNEETRTYTISIVYNDNSTEIINIIQDRIYYMIVKSEDTECFGDDYYYVNLKYKGYTKNKIDIFVEYVKGNLIDTMSPNCMDYDEAETVQKVCVDGDLYLQVNYIKDGVVIKTQLELSVLGDCTDADTNATETEFRINTGITVCVNDTPYYVEEKWAKVDEQWIKLYPTITQTSLTEAPESNICDVIDPSSSGSTIYRWVDTDETYCLTSSGETNCTSSSTSTYCDGYNYYRDTIYYVDPLCNGNWEKSGNTVTTLIEANSAECGYEEDTPNDTLSFTWSGSTNTFNLNRTTYTASSTSYTATLSELGITDLTSCYQTFANIGLTNLYSFPDTSNVTDFQSMFNDCIAVTTLDLSKFDTSSATQMQKMFYYCVKLTSLDLSSFDTSNVYNMESIFYGCKKLETLDVRSWDVNHITSSSFYRNIFTSCDALTSLIVKEGTYDWWCARLTEAGIFCDIITIGETPTPDTGTTGDLSFEFSRTPMTYKLNGTTYTATSSPYSTTLEDLGITELTSCNSTFFSGTSITNLISFPDTSAVTDMGSMFYFCRILTELNLSNWNTSNVTNMNSMFDCCESLTSLDVSSFDTSAVTDMNDMFSFCRRLTSLNLSNWNTSNVTNMNSMFNSCESLTSLDVSSFNTSACTNMSYMFDFCESLTSLDLSSFNTSNVTNMSSMFYYCYSLTSLDVSNFNTSNVTNMSDMFYNCSKLTSLNLSSWNTSNVTDMEQMFFDCRSLTSLNLSNWNTSNVTDMEQMFSNCTKLTSLDVSSFNTSACTNMINMFSKCSGLTSLDLSSFNTSNVTSMNYMFLDCRSLQTLDVSSWDVNHITSHTDMFYSCNALTSLIVKSGTESWWTSRLTSAGIQGNVTITSV